MGLAAAGIDVSTLLVVLIALTCPLMMLFMMTGMNRDGHRQDTPADRAPHGRDGVERGPRRTGPSGQRLTRRLRHRASPVTNGHCCAPITVGPATT
ncbi:MAG TPA: DUF2933 domain-containing protein [Kribbellaceae bacterium]